MALLGPQSSIIFGLLGNLVSFLVYLAPLPTFYRIFKKKSTEGFQPIPYSVALFSAMLLLYYAFLKVNAFILITINAIGCVIESLYLMLYMIYAAKSAKIYTTKLILLFNIGAFGLIVLFTYIFSVGSLRLTVVGWICAVCSVCVFAAPLSVIRLVIRTKSVEYMPFPLSCCLTICAVMWFLYGLSIHDYFIATPNVLGVGFGVTQMILYLIYTKRSNEIMPVVDPKEQSVGITTAQNQETINPNGTLSGEIEIQTLDQPSEELMNA
ncbi:Bidirectional sugar transporter SWEET [Melia azedarach]|uniref:Bidirectional sugar transporter SWEET n=1 Tax=Melia azedarach TaxID=155640 RepID=A0ACC1YWN6_MELAZ|nr:Bidirectional sugar transporter SWEET [Melia azedarach]